MAAPMVPRALRIQWGLAMGVQPVVRRWSGCSSPTSFPGGGSTEANTQPAGLSLPWSLRDPLMTVGTVTLVAPMPCPHSLKGSLCSIFLKLPHVRVLPSSCSGPAETQVIGDYSTAAGADTKHLLDTASGPGATSTISLPRPPQLETGSRQLEG